MTIFWPFLTTYPLALTFSTRQFWTTYPPPLVNVVYDAPNRDNFTRAGIMYHASKEKLSTSYLYEKQGTFEGSE